MMSGYPSRWSPRLGLVAVLGLVAILALLPAFLSAADRSRPSKPPLEIVQLFSGMESGQIEVKLIPKDSTECRIIVENKTTKPLRIQLPAAFAGVAVLAQDDFGGGGGNGGGGGGGGGGQSMGGGGGMGGGGMGGGGMGGGGGMFNVPAEKVGNVKLRTVCLEHGKPDPRPAMKYRIVPIEEYTDDVKVHELCRMLGQGNVPQRVAQVAAWHLSSEMSWQQLAAKKLRFANGTWRSYFSGREIQAAMQVVTATAELAKRRQGNPKQDSLSQY